MGFAPRHVGGTRFTKPHDVGNGRQPHGIKHRAVEINLENRKHSQSPFCTILQRHNRMSSVTGAHRMAKVANNLPSLILKLGFLQRKLYAMCAFHTRFACPARHVCYPHLCKSHQEFLMSFETKASFGCPNATSTPTGHVPHRNGSPSMPPPPPPFVCLPVHQKQPLYGGGGLVWSK